MSKLTPYIKPTRYVHSSGYRTFEVGYLSDNDKTKYVITKGSDHVYTDYSALYDSSKSFGINMDLTKSGYIRIWSSGKSPIKWTGEAIGLSSMSLEIGIPSITNNMEAVEL